MALSWLAFNFATGQSILDLEGIALTGDLVQSIGQPETSTVTFNTETRTPAPDWLFSTQPGGAALIAYQGSAQNPTIVGGGIVTQRVRDLAPVVSLQLMTPECYLDACPVGQYNLPQAQINQDTIVHDLVTNFGMPSAAGYTPVSWGFNHVNASSATQATSYTAASNTTVLGALQAVSAVAGGPEWLTSWLWNQSTGTITPTLTYGNWIGRRISAQPGGQQLPVVVFENADCVTAAFTEDFTAGKGANKVVAYGSAASGISSAVPVTSNIGPAANANNRALWAFQFQPNQQTIDQPTLNNYATAALAQMQAGANSATLAVPLDQPGKTFGVDWNLGDEVGFYFTGTQFPTPLSGTGRVMGVRINNYTVTPMLTKVVFQ